MSHFNDNDFNDFYTDDVSEVIKGNKNPKEYTHEEIALKTINYLNEGHVIFKLPPQEEYRPLIGMNNPMLQTFEVISSSPRRILKRNSDPIILI